MRNTTDAKLLNLFLGLESQLKRLEHIAYRSPRFYCQHQLDPKALPEVIFQELKQEQSLALHSMVKKQIFTQNNTEMILRPEKNVVLYYLHIHISSILLPSHESSVIFRLLKDFFLAFFTRQVGLLQILSSYRNYFNFIFSDSFANYQIIN